jgi:flavodoxin
MRKILVIYYSRTGHTRQVAKAISAACEADLEEIRDMRSRAGWLGYWRSGREAWRKEQTTIRAVEKRPEDYDLVVIGTPVWAGNISSPVRTYVTQQHGRFKQVALFCTEGGTGGERALRELAILCEHVPLATLIVTERELKSGEDRRKVTEFTKSFG